MVIHLSPTLEERIMRAAQAKGLQPEQWVEDALTEYLELDSKSRDEISDARRQLQELLKHKRRVIDLDAAVHEAKRSAGQLYEANADWIENAAAHGIEHGSL